MPILRIGGAESNSDFHYLAHQLFDRRISMQSGRGQMGMSKHRKSGHAGHNADLQQTARKLNKEAEEVRKKKDVQKEPMYDSVQEAFRKGKRK